MGASQQWGSEAEPQPVPCFRRAPVAQGAACGSVVNSPSASLVNGEQRPLWKVRNHVGNLQCVPPSGPRSPHPVREPISRRDRRRGLSLGTGALSEKQAYQPAGWDEPRVMRELRAGASRPVSTQEVVFSLEHMQVWTSRLRTYGMT